MATTVEPPSLTVKPPSFCNVLVVQFPKEKVRDLARVVKAFIGWSRVFDLISKTNVVANNMYLCASSTRLFTSFSRIPDSAIDMLNNICKAYSGEGIDYALRAISDLSALCSYIVDTMEFVIPAAVNNLLLQQFSAVTLFIGMVISLRFDYKDVKKLEEVDIGGSKVQEAALAALKTAKKIDMALAASYIALSIVLMFVSFGVVPVGAAFMGISMGTMAFACATAALICSIYSFVHEQRTVNVAFKNLGVKFEDFVKIVDEKLLPRIAKTHLYAVRNLAVKMDWESKQG